MFLPELSYSKIIVYTQSITNAGIAHTHGLHEEEGLVKHVHLGGCLSGVCIRQSPINIIRNKI